MYNCLRFEVGTINDPKGGTMGGLLGAVLGGVNGVLSGVQTFATGLLGLLLGSG